MDPRKRIGIASTLFAGGRVGGIYEEKRGLGIIDEKRERPSGSQA
jgi:hypothetical protein